MDRCKVSMEKPRNQISFLLIYIINSGSFSRCPQRMEGLNTAFVSVEVFLLVSDVIMEL